MKSDTVPLTSPSLEVMTPLSLVRELLERLTKGAKLVQLRKSTESEIAAMGLRWI